jgi:hypothetical protein
MKIPPKVRIKARISYPVHYSDLIDDDPNCNGRAYPDKRIIVLKNRISKSDLNEAFIHECLHAIEYEYTKGIPHWVVEILGSAILKILKLNGVI